MEEIAPDVAIVPFLIANTYLVGKPQSWVLVDSGTPGNAEKIKQAAEARFGPGAKPNAIILTHGHGDHSGSAKPLAEFWSVPIYVHRLELPYLTGQSTYPPLDPTAPGFFSVLSRFFPAFGADLRPHIFQISAGNPFPGIDGWETIDTPGHSPGHVAFYRKSDGILLAGDAVTTMNLDRAWDILTKKKTLCRPPVPATIDWQQARRSVATLASLKPQLIAPGHGIPLKNASNELQNLADNFPIPPRGRYVRTPAQTDEHGVVSLPPAPPDRTPKIAAGLAVAASLTVAGLLLTRRR